MTQRFVEIVVGRLITDETFRTGFLQNPEGVLSELLDRGVHLTRAEMAALLATDASLWEQAAGSVDPRLQKVNLKENS